MSKSVFLIDSPSDCLHCEMRNVIYADNKAYQQCRLNGDGYKLESFFKEEDLKEGWVSPKCPLVPEECFVRKEEYNNGWIPVKKRLPNKEEYLKNDGRFIVTDGNRVYQSIYDIYINKCFRTLQLNCLVDLGYQSSFEVDKRVIAWQQLPKPYRN